MSYSVFDVAEWFLQKEEMTHKKLQKICYYAQAWYATLFGGRRLINGDFEAWIHGPVHPDLYKKFAYNGLCKIEPSGRKLDIELQDLDFLNIIYNTFGEFDADYLEAMTHAEEPWKKARMGLAPDQPGNKKITLDSMREFYTNLKNANQYE